MVLYISRDYQSQNSGSSGRSYISSYLTAIFLRRILGYSYIGDTLFPINGGGTIASTTIAVASNGVSLPPGSGVINVASTTGFPSQGFIFVASSAGIQTCFYTGLNATQFTGVSGGTGTMSTGGSVTYGSMLIATGDSTPTVAPTFGAGTRAGISNNGSLVEVSIPTSIRMVIATDVGRILVLKSSLYPTRNSGIFLISSLAGNNTTIAVASNGVSLPTGTINVASTVGFPASGSIFVLTDAGPQTVNYTGTTGTTFTGCTGGTGTMSTGNPVNNANRYVIDYRSNGQPALVEAADTVPWYLYERDTLCPISGNDNSNVNGYRSNGNSTTPRIILQSPHAMGYQVRICNESATYTVNSNSPMTGAITVAPGFNGDSAGDFPVGGNHLHGVLFGDYANVGDNLSKAIGISMGNVTSATNLQFRYTLIGDDSGNTFSIFARRSNATGFANSFLLTFGIPDNEPTPLPLKNIQRLFTIGHYASDQNSSPANNISLFVGNGNTAQLCGGAAFWDEPVACNPCMLAYVTGNNQFAGPASDAQAGDCPIISSTELITVDLVSGAYPNYQHSGTSYALQLAPRYIGTLPVIRFGRTNFGDFTLTTDAGSWTANAATNASPIQITTSAANNLVTGQTVTINGATGNTAANGTWVVTVINSTQFTLNGSTGNGTFSGTASVLRGASHYHLRNGVYIPWNGPAVVA